MKPRQTQCGIHADAAFLACCFSQSDEEPLHMDGIALASSSQVMVIAPDLARVLLELALHNQCLDMRIDLFSRSETIVLTFL